VAPIGRPYTTFYWSAVVNIALSGTPCDTLARICGLAVFAGAWLKD